MHQNLTDILPKGTDTRLGFSSAKRHFQILLRHSAATEMLANGAPPIGVQRVLGHRSLRTTLETYAHACDTHAAEAMALRFGR